MDLKKNNGTGPNPGFLAAVGNRIATFRTAQRLTQEALAAKSGLCRPHLTDIEHGRRNASVLALWKIAVALGVPMSRLFE